MICRLAQQMLRTKLKGSSDLESPFVPVQAILCEHRVHQARSNVDIDLAGGSLKYLQREGKVPERPPNKCLSFDKSCLRH